MSKCRFRVGSLRRTRKSLLSVALVIAVLFSLVPLVLPGLTLWFVVTLGKN